MAYAINRTPLFNGSAVIGFGKSRDVRTDVHALGVRKISSGLLSERFHVQLAGGGCEAGKPPRLRTGDRFLLTHGWEESGREGAGPLTVREILEVGDHSAVVLASRRALSLLG